MAYMDFRGLEPSAATLTTRTGVVHPTETCFVAGFSPLEWTVISLARYDRGDAVMAPGRVRRFIALLFGGEPGRPLADPRLEVLRRVAVRLWNRRSLPAAEQDAFHRRGFTPAHLDLLRANIAAAAEVRA